MEHSHGKTAHLEYDNAFVVKTVFLFEIFKNPNLIRICVIKDRYHKQYFQSSWTPEGLKNEENKGKKIKITCF